MADELGDFFGGGQGGAPGTTWDTAKVGSKIKGIVVPGDVNDPEKAYVTEHATNVAGEYLYWNSDRNGKPQVTDAKDPVSGIANRPVTQAVITLLTEYREQEYMTDKAKERADEAERKDDGVRRYFVRGASATKTFKEALKAAKQRGPQVAAEIEITLVKREPNDYGGKTNIVETAYSVPTAQTKAKVEAYIAERAEAADDIDGDDIPF